MNPVEVALAPMSVLGPVGIGLVSAITGYLLGRGRMRARSALALRAAAAVLTLAGLILLGGGSHGPASKETITKSAIILSFAFGPFAVGWAIADRTPDRHATVGAADTALLAVLATTVVSAWPARVRAFTVLDPVVSSLVLISLGVLVAYAGLALASALVRSRATRAAFALGALGAWLAFVVRTGPLADPFERLILAMPVLHLAVWAVATSGVERTPQEAPG